MPFDFLGMEQALVETVLDLSKEHARGDAARDRNLRLMRGPPFDDFDLDGFGFDEEPVMLTPQGGGRNSLRTAEELDKEFPNQRRDLLCPECKHAKMILKDGKFGIFYGCKNWRGEGCKGSVNCHKPTAEPMGTPVNQATKEKRKETHLLFDRLWNGQDNHHGVMRREAAYKWMQETLNLPEALAHIGMFDIATCDRLIQALRLRLGEVTRFERITEMDIV